MPTPSPLPLRCGLFELLPASRQLLLDGRLAVVSEACKGPCADRRQGAVDCGAAVHGSEPREGSGILRRRSRRGAAERALQDSRAAYRGEVDLAFAWLERAYAQHDA